MIDSPLLANPIYTALTTRLTAFAQACGAARRFDAAIGPLAGLAIPSDAAWDDLRELAGPRGLLVLFLEKPFQARPGWTLVRDGELTQMICAQHTALAKNLAKPVTMRRLTAADVPAMLELTALTEPGPFRERTHELGVFYGILDGKRLLAMAGQRLRVPGFVEVSAVCTHPDARGRGYARMLMSAVMDEIVAGGATPMLHAFADNQSAIRVYRDLGFEHSRTLQLAVVCSDA